MKKVLITLFLFFAVITGVFAQNISVSSFKDDPSDLTANQSGTTVLDQNGEKCALIKVRTTQTGFSFDVGALGITKTEQKTAEIWVYVPHGVRRMTIQHQLLGTCEYSIPIPVERAKTYIMELTTGKVQTIVEEAVTSQYVVFQVEPKNNVIIVLDNEPLQVSEGTAMKRMKFGTYDYRIDLDQYHSEVGKVTVNDPQNKHIVNVTLRPAFGWIDIKETPSNKDAQVYVDNKLLGNIPLKSNGISSGNHTVRVIKPLYGIWEQQVAVNDNEITSITPELSANFSNVTLTAPNNAEIWINGEKKGTGTWSGALIAGEYVFETRAEHHRSVSTTRTIAASAETATIQLPSPTPIVGKLEVSTLPAMSEVLVDGKKVGETPVVLNSILEGSHEVVVQKEGRGKLVKIVNIEEGANVIIGEELSNVILPKRNFDGRKMLSKIEGYSYGHDENGNVQKDLRTIITFDYYDDTYLKTLVRKEYYNGDFLYKTVWERDEFKNTLTRADYEKDSEDKSIKYVYTFNEMGLIDRRVIVDIGYENNKVSSMFKKDEKCTYKEQPNGEYYLECIRLKKYIKLIGENREFVLLSDIKKIHLTMISGCLYYCRRQFWNWREGQTEPPVNYEKDIQKKGTCYDYTKENDLNFDISRIYRHNRVAHRNFYGIEFLTEWGGCSSQYLIDMEEGVRKFDYAYDDENNIVKVFVKDAYNDRIILEYDLAYLY